MNMNRRMWRALSALAGVLALAATTMTVVPTAAQAQQKKVVYLTFDDGPSIDQPSRDVLAVLDRFDVRATFFVIGSAVDADPEGFRLMRDGGHAFGNHSYTHPDLTSLTSAELADELDRAQQAVTAAGGPTLTCYRPPAGRTNDAVRAATAERGLAEIFWEIDGGDVLRPLPSVQSIVDNLNQAVDGDNIIMHDGSFGQLNTAPALEQWLTESGDDYEFRLVEDCVDAAGPADALAPLNCVADLVNDQPRVRWARQPGDNARQFRILRDQNGSNNEITVGTVGSGVTSWVDTTAFNASNAYRLETVAANGTTALRTCGPNGGLVTGIPGGPQPPSSCTATVNGNTVTVDWVRAANDNAQSFIIRRSFNGGAFGWHARVDEPGTTYVSRVTQRGTYRYTVENRDGNGVVAKTDCTPSEGVTVGAGSSGAPVAPTECTAVRNGRSYDISWTAAANDNADRYAIRRARNGGTVWWAASTPAPATGLTNAVPDNASYSYSVEAIRSPWTLSSRTTCVVEGEPPPSGPAKLKLEAESVDRGGALSRYSNGAASRDLYVRSSDDGRFFRSRSSSRMDFDFEVVEAGTYELRGRTRANRSSGRSNSFWVAGPGSPNPGWRWNLDRSSSFTTEWARINDGPRISFDLAPGTTTISLYMREDGSGLDWLELVKVR